jgi:hypothetical protein
MYIVAGLGMATLGGRVPVTGGTAGARLCLGPTAIQALGITE